MENQEKIDENILFPGVVEDPRDEAEKAQDYVYDEIEPVAGAVVPDWQERAPESFLTLPVRNQDGSSSCVAQTVALMLGIDNIREEGRFIEFSAGDVYNRRKNKPGLGMWGVDAMTIAKDFGATFESLMPSENLNETQIHDIDRKVSDEQIGKVFKSGGYIQLPFDVDKIAQFMEQYRVNGVAKPVMTWFRFNYSEWSTYPKENGQPHTVHHSVTARDYFLINGKKYILVQDSWGHHSSSLQGLRLIDQEFIDNHMTFCCGMLDLSNAWREGAEPVKPNPDHEPKPDEKPKHTFNVTLKYGVTSDPEIVALQDCLKYEGIFPTSIGSTGNYFQITAKAVKAFQLKYAVASEAEINNLAGRSVGPKTRAKLNELYGN